MQTHHHLTFLRRLGVAAVRGLDYRLYKGFQDVRTHVQRRHGRRGPSRGRNSYRQKPFEGRWGKYVLELFLASQPRRGVIRVELIEDITLAKGNKAFTVEGLGVAWSCSTEVTRPRPVNTTTEAAAARYYLKPRRDQPKHTG